MRTFSKALGSLVAFAVVGAPLAVATPATAAPVAAAAVHCETVPGTARITSERHVPHWRQHADTGTVTQKDLEALLPRETRRGVVAREVAPRLPSIVVIPVFAHVIRGKHRGERPAMGPRRIRNMLTILNNGMAGKQSSASTFTRYRFALRKVDYTKRDGWFHAYFNGPREQKMKRKLHRGGAAALNLYLTGGPRDVPILGWSRFPWQYASAPRLDGVSVNIEALPGGRATGYNLGDTLIHEVGHWLGLFHPFQNGCEGYGDSVADTPAEDEPSFYCQTTRDTCPAPGLDPVRNFMDFSYDSCMNMFTRGQVQRMDTAFERWRF